MAHCHAGCVLLFLHQRAPLSPLWFLTSPFHRLLNEVHFFRHLLWPVAGHHVHRRLKDKVTSLEKQLAVSDELKERYRTASEMGSMPGSRRVSTSSVTAGACSLVPRCCLFWQMAACGAAAA